MKWFLFFLLAGAAWAADEVKLPGLRIVGGDTKAVEADGRVARYDNVLEFIACEPETREYESLLTLTCKPSALKFSLLLIGCEPDATNGTPLILEVEWRDQEKVRRVPVEQWLVDRRAGKPPAEPLPFFFSGSMMVTDLFTTNKIFQADAEQAHIALWWQPSILINLKRDAGIPYRGDDQGFEVNTNAVPASGTPVKLILRPRPPAQQPPRP
jgi:hypothetical protein